MTIMQTVLSREAVLFSEGPFNIGGSTVESNVCSPNAFIQGKVVKCDNQNGPSNNINNHGIYT